MRASMLRLLAAACLASAAAPVDALASDIPGWVSTVKRLLGVRLDYRLLSEGEGVEFNNEPLSSLDPDVSYLKHTFAFELSSPLVDYTYRRSFTSEAATAGGRSADYRETMFNGTGLFRLNAWLNDGELDWTRGSWGLLLTLLGSSSYRNRVFTTDDYRYDGTEVYTLVAIGYEGNRETFASAGETYLTIDTSRFGLMFSYTIHYIERMWRTMERLREAWGVARECPANTWQHFVLACDDDTMFSLFWMPGFDWYAVSKTIEARGTFAEERTKDGSGLGVAPSAYLVYMDTNPWYELSVMLFAAAWWGRESLGQLDNGTHGWRLSLSTSVAF